MKDNALKVSVRWLDQMGLLVETGNKKICIDYFASPTESLTIPRRSLHMKLPES